MFTLIQILFMTFGSVVIELTIMAHFKGLHALAIKHPLFIGVGFSILLAKGLGLIFGASGGMMFTVWLFSTIVTSSIYKATPTYNALRSKLSGFFSAPSRKPL